MNSQHFRLFFLATLLAYSQQISLPTDSSYNAGVVEYTVQTGTPSERCSKTTQGFIEIIESDSTADLDILVFPEYVLNSVEMATFVPHPDQNVTPCIQPDYEIFLVELSCATRARGIYVVLNLVEKELCSENYGSVTQNPCPANGVRYFNTNVVLNRNGQVISRYRKTHLWRQEYKSRAVLVEPELATFSTDFGVTFGHFICFDMLFYEPAMRLILELNITDIIYPTYWFSELPFLSAVQLQEGWAYANNINLLAADGSQPSGRTTGSGIYAGRAGRLIAQINENPTQILLKERVPKKSVSGATYELPAQVVPQFQPQLITPRYKSLATFRDYNLDIFHTQLLDENFLNVTQNLCYNEFCCDFQVQRRLIGISADYTAYRYRLGVYLGNETSFIRVDRSSQAVCAIFACTNDQLLSCGRIFSADVDVANQHYFEKIRIVGRFPAAPRRLIMPSTLDGVMLPLNVAQYNWTETPPAKELSETLIEMELIQPKNDLLTFGIWANFFTQLPTNHNLDHLQPPHVNNTNGSSGSTISGSGSSVLAAFASSMLLMALSLVFKL